VDWTGNVSGHCSHYNSAAVTHRSDTGIWIDGWLRFNGILSTQVVAMSCLPAAGSRVTDD